MHTGHFPSYLSDRIPSKVHPDTGPEISEIRPDTGPELMSGAPSDDQYKDPFKTR